MRCLLLLFFLLLPGFSDLLRAAVPPEVVSPEAVALHERGLAELENEKPENAEPLYREVVKRVPKDPLGYANLAIALLRQQKYQPALLVVGQGLEAFPGEPRLLTIRGEILQWTGDLEGALAVLEEAARRAPDDLETLYAAYSLATTLESEAAEALALRTLEGLAELRPENAVVLLQLGQRAAAAGDRERATRAFVRIGELLWQAPPIAERALGMVEKALEGDDLSRARVPAVRLENVLKVSAMYRESLRELKTGIQGVPITSFAGEVPSAGFGKPLDVTFGATGLDDRPSVRGSVVTGDFDGDEKADIARLVVAKGDGGGAAGNVLEVRLAKAGWKTASELPAADVDVLRVADLDNDTHLDLFAFGPRRGAVWLGQGDGTFTAAPEDLGLAAVSASAAAVIDFDIEGDLDVAVVGRGAGSGELYRNSLQGPLAAVGVKALPRDLKLADVRDVVATDLDRDGDLDLAVAHGGGVAWLDNLRQGRFADRGVAAGLDKVPALRGLVSADLDNDGRPDLVGVAAEGLVAFHNTSGEVGGTFRAWDLEGLPRGHFDALLAFDADNDGRLDLAAAGEKGVVVALQDVGGTLRGEVGGTFRAAEITGAPEGAAGLAAADLDLDGDLDLAVASSAGLAWLENRGGHENGWLSLRLRGLAKGNSKNNVFGVGSVVEVKNGLAYQFREASGDVLHLGLGERDVAEILRVVWTNGVPQNRLDVAGEQRIVEEQLLKGSCPFLYAWNGERFVFVTDLLWAAPIGLPVGRSSRNEVVYAPDDPSELVRVDGLVAADGIYRLRLTEELWEAAFFDHLRLWVADHPETVEVASNLRVLPGEELPEVVLGSRDLRPVAAAWDGEGRDVTDRVRTRDEVYADGYTESRYQGLARAPWSFTFDLGEAPAAPVRLHLDGWIFPSDASLNLAIAQRDDLVVLAPRLEVETADGWQTLVEAMGFPAGKTKTMVIDTPPLPAGARRLRIVTSLWLHWDRLAWTLRPADDEVRIVAKLAPTVADLRYRGFSAPVRRAPNAPHVFDYQKTRLDSPWLPFPGPYTRYGDVRPLLEMPDDFSVILGPGDEIVLEIDARHLPPPPPGHARTLFLESHGWDKDADRNTFEGQGLEPLPFRAMGRYGEPFPDTPHHRDYRREWLTREVE